MNYNREEEERESKLTCMDFFDQWKVEELINRRRKEEGENKTIFFIKESKTK